MNFCKLLGFLLLFVAVSQKASANSPIKMKIIPGGQVDLMEVEARYHGRAITVSGTGFETFPRQTCGHAQIALLDADGRTLLVQDVKYQAPESTPRSYYRSRFVTFVATVPFTASVASGRVRHLSNGGCQHAWSLEYALDLLVNGMFSEPPPRSSPTPPLS